MSEHIWKSSFVKLKYLPTATRIWLRFRGLLRDYRLLRELCARYDIHGKVQGCIFEDAVDKLPDCKFHIDKIPDCGDRRIYSQRPLTGSSQEAGNGGAWLQRGLR